MDENPALQKVVMASFDLAESGGANRIGYRVNKTLGGYRIGPYYLNAKPKGQNGEFTLTIIFHTEILFIDKNGHETGDLTAAVKIKERFYSFEILPIGKTSAFYLGNRF